MKYRNIQNLQGLFPSKRGLHLLLRPLGLWLLGLSCSFFVAMYTFCAVRILNRCAARSELSVYRNQKAISIRGSAVPVEEPRSRKVPTSLRKSAIRSGKKENRLKPSDARSAQAGIRQISHKPAWLGAKNRTFHRMDSAGVNLFSFELEIRRDRPCRIHVRPEHTCALADGVDHIGCDRDV